MEKRKLTDTRVWLYSGIPGGMLKCLPIVQPLCWNGQMEGIYTSISSALIVDRPMSKTPVAIHTEQSISREHRVFPRHSNLISRISQKERDNSLGHYL